MKVSLIVAVYKDIEALTLIVNALKNQTYKNFELIVAEDNNSEEMNKYIASIEGLDVQHTVQEDKGIRKTRSVNNAILKSTGEYLIFIDGDCIPYSRFIESHVDLANKDNIITGRRVNLGPLVSQRIRLSTLDFATLEKQYFWYIPILLKDGITHIEQGFSFSTKGMVYKFILSKRRKSNLSLLGCNYSCYKSHMLEIDGYDESYGETAVADDTDLQWRFEALGLQMKSCKMLANVFHLNHDRKFRDLDMGYQMKNINNMQNKKLSGNYVAIQGLSSHDTI